MTKKTIWAVLFTVLLKAATTTMAATPPIDSHDTGVLQGSWRLVGEEGYYSQTKQMLQSMRIFIKFGAHTYEDPAGNSPYFDKGTYTIDSSASPKTLDLHATKGMGKGANTPAIYEIKGDTLRLCICAIPGRRARKFTTEDDCTLKTFHREKQ